MVTETAKWHNSRNRNSTVGSCHWCAICLARHTDAISDCLFEKRSQPHHQPGGRSMLKTIFRHMELGEKVNILPVDKDIGCLITIEDFLSLDLGQVMDTVIIPGRTMAHEKD